MLGRQLALHGALLALALAACATRQNTTASQACTVVDGASLQDCLDQLPDGATLGLPPGRLVVTRPMVVRRRVTITTVGLSPGAPRCADDGTGCVVLALRLAQPGAPGEHAFSIRAAGAALDHIVVEGARADPARDDHAACNGASRPSMGLLEVSAANVAITGSVLRDAACYSAVVVNPTANGFHFTDNAVLSNGSHDGRAMWADGLTLLDGADAVVSGNLFRDNTDVQLVLGGCARCTIANNRIETTDGAGRGAFAGLLVHGWPHTSGDYADSVIVGNSIDCGPARQCGFGLGVGGRAWYVSRTYGGLIANNTVRRAGVGINVDDATGPVTMRDNQVSESGGTVRSHCGAWMAGAVNISPASRRFVDATAGVVMPAEAVTSRSYAGCLPGA